MLSLYTLRSVILTLSLRNRRKTFWKTTPLTARVHSSPCVSSSVCLLNDLIIGTKKNTLTIKAQETAILWQQDCDYEPGCEWDINVNVLRDFYWCVSYPPPFILNRRWVAVIADWLLVFSVQRGFFVFCDQIMSLCI